MTSIDLTTVFADTPEKDTINLATLLAETTGLPHLIARILVGRGITTPDDAGIFLRPRLEDLSDPFMLPDVEKGIERVIKAVRDNETICIWGDYDADGVSSLALMYNFLGHLGVSPVVHIPTREEGYGLNAEKVEELAHKGVNLIVSLDCGSSNADEVDRARSLGIDTIVIDHHEVGDRLPEAIAVINPKRKDSLFPTRDLAACGVTFFFLLGLRRIMHKLGLLRSHINLKRELDLVTVGTVGDMVPLTGDNRILVRHGMEVMNSRPKPWLKAMLGSRVISKGLVNEFALGFVIVPRINAAGRVSRPHPSFDFLVADDDVMAASLLGSLQKANNDRQRLEKRIHDEIVQSINNTGLSGRRTIVVFDEKWHAGVLGIVAQKLAERFGKPAIVITRVKDIWKGSGRGCDGMDLFESICSLSPLLLKYGGHRYACGISLTEENLTVFRDAFEEAVPPETASERKRAVHVDTEARFDELTTDVMDRLEEIGPFGIGNPRPNLKFDAAGIYTADNGRTKIIDDNNRTWYGWFPAKGPIQKDGGITFVASPALRMDMGDRFINFTIKDLVERS